MAAKVYIVIVNFKGWQDTIECLESLLKLSYVNFQILVIDNSVDNNSIVEINCWAKNGHFVETKFPDLVFPLTSKPYTSFRFVEEHQLLKFSFSEKILLIKAASNDGFSAANNIGLKYALQCDDFQFAWILNNDTVAEPTSLEALIKCMNEPKNRMAGIMGAKVMEYYGRHTIQSAGGGLLIKPVAYSRLIGAGQTDENQFDISDLHMDFVAGTSMLVRKLFLKEVGLLSEDYFLYYEEPDWAERAKGLNWTIRYCFKAIVYHKGGSTTGGKGYSTVKESTDVSDFYFQRAKILFTLKHYWYWLPILYLSFILIIFNRLRRRQFTRIKVIIRMLLQPNAKCTNK